MAVVRCSWSHCVAEVGVPCSLLFAKLAHPRLWLDIRPLLPPAWAEALTAGATPESFRRVFSSVVDRIPGEPWARTPAMKDRFDIAW